MEKNKKNTLLETDTIEFEQMVQQLKNKYGSIYQMEIADQRIIFKPLSRREYKEVMALTLDDEEDSIVMKRENMVAKMAIVYPSEEEVEDIIERYAGVAEVVCDECMRVSGFLNQNERVVTKL